MMYVPGTTLTTPMVLQGIQPTLLPSTTRYYAAPSTIVPAVQFMSTPYVYPAYGLIAKSMEKDDNEKYQSQQVTQHVIHHHPVSCSGCCECCCCPERDESSERRPRSRSRSPSPPTHDQHRQSRRDQFDSSKYDFKLLIIEERIERLRRELSLNQISKQEKSTETIDYYHPPRPVEPPMPYKQHYDPPKPRPRSRSRPRSGSAHRSSSLPREPWRSSNQNDYPWRDAHLPAYREATLERAQTPTHESRTWNETAHDRSHSNTRPATSYHSTKDYIYRPSSETEARHYYTQTTGKNADHEVHQALHGSHATTYKYAGSSAPCHSHSFYSDVPNVQTTTHNLHKVDSTQHHNLYGCDKPCLHVLPKHGDGSKPPYLKIYNAPVTYLH